MSNRSVFSPPCRRTCLNGPWNLKAVTPRYDIYRVLQDVFFEASNIMHLSYTLRAFDTLLPTNSLSPRRPVEASCAHHMGRAVPSFTGLSILVCSISFVGWYAPRWGVTVKRGITSRLCKKVDSLSQSGTLRCHLSRCGVGTPHGIGPLIQDRMSYL